MEISPQLQSSAKREQLLPPLQKHGRNEDGPVRELANGACPHGRRGQWLLSAKATEMRNEPSVRTMKTGPSFIVQEIGGKGRKGGLELDLDYIQIERQPEKPGTD